MHGNIFHFNEFVKTVISCFRFEFACQRWAGRFIKKILKGVQRWAPEIHAINFDLNSLTYMCPTLDSKI